MNAKTLACRHPIAARSATAAVITALIASLCTALPALADDTPAFSPAERALFLEDQFSTVKPPTTLRYAFRKSGSLEAGFDDRVALSLKPQADGSCCATSSEFLSGPRAMRMPDIEAAKGNPVTMYFLERDVREMERLTKGKAYHFRKQVRMAIAESAKVRDVSLSFNGKPIAAREVTITPFATDPNRPRFEKYANKDYVFLLSDAVPGGVFGIRTEMIDATPGAPPLIVEELWVEGADKPAASAPK